jgi:hypothetical protein
MQEDYSRKILTRLLELETQPIHSLLLGDLDLIPGLVMFIILPISWLQFIKIGLDLLFLTLTRLSVVKWL